MGKTGGSSGGGKKVGSSGTQQAPVQQMSYQSSIPYTSNYASSLMQPQQQQSFASPSANVGLSPDLQGVGTGEQGVQTQLSDLDVLKQELAAQIQQTGTGTGINDL